MELSADIKPQKAQGDSSLASLKQLTPNDRGCIHAILVHFPS